MAARVWGGVAGWIAALLPLVAANVADQYIEFDSHELLLLGAGVLLGGILLGGFIAATIGGRAGRGVSRSASASAAGAIAAALYAATIIAVVLSGRLISSEPTLVSQHPLRASGVVVFLGGLMLAVALATGALRGVKASETPAHGAAASRPAPRPATGPRPPSYAPPISNGAPRPPSRPRASPWGVDDGYPPRDPRPQQSRPQGYGRDYADPTRQRRDSGPRVSPARAAQWTEADRWERR